VEGRDEHDFALIRWSERSLQVFAADLESDSEVADQAYLS
jgi:hypothetical protein